MCPCVLGTLSPPFFLHKRSRSYISIHILLSRSSVPQHWLGLNTVSVRWNLHLPFCWKPESLQGFKRGWNVSTCFFIMCMPRLESRLRIICDCPFHSEDGGTEKGTLVGTSSLSLFTEGRMEGSRNLNEFWTSKIYLAPLRLHRREKYEDICPCGTSELRRQTPTLSVPWASCTWF